MLDTTIGGRYKIIRTLGGGGFGETFVAEDLQLPDRMQCVVKRLKPLSNDLFVLQTARRLFETEAKVLHMLGKHNQIPQLLAHFEENQEFYLVQELIEGNSLDEVLVKPMPEPQVIAMLLDVLSILEFVHQQNVIHRDLKPANLIRRRQDGKLVLIDFGAVKQMRTQMAGEPNSSMPSNVTVAIGTPGYMPSEQSSGKPRPCSDIYALGAIAIQALTGRMPGQLAENPTTGEIDWHNLAPVSPELASIVDLMVRYDFRTRYQSATEVIEALRQLAQPVAATEMSAPPHYPNSDRSNPSFSPRETVATIALKSNDAFGNAPNHAPRVNQSRFSWKIVLGIGSVLAIAIAVPAVVLNLPKSTQTVQLEKEAGTITSANTSPTPTVPVKSNTPTPTASPTRIEVSPTQSPSGETAPPLISAPNYDFLSNRAIAEADLDGRSDIELDVMRNEVFARYGCRFKDAELQAYFNAQSWYRPVYDPDGFPDNLLTEVEKQNVQFILAYQKTLAQHQAQNPCYASSIRWNRDPTSPLNVRSGAGTSFEIAGKVSYGSELKVVDEQNGWLQISSPISGWVAKSRTGCSG